MDSIGGAKILSERLLRRDPEELPADPAPPVVAADALPLFHWTGVAPAAPAEPAPPRPRRWRRSR